MTQSRLVIFHYHLLPGGVTSVISKGIQAILQSEQETGLKDLTIVSGGDPGGEEDFRKFFAGCEEKARGRGIKLNYRTLREVGYAPADQGKDEKSAQELADRLAELFPRSIWWIHNHHIGKNVRFTHALMLTARKRPEQILFLQIHDFPENGRFTNWRLLKDTIPLPLYPAGPCVHYITINSRDRTILTNAGLPAERIHNLPNPVSLGSPKIPRPAGEVKEILVKHLGADFPGYIPGAPWGLYPVRTIRRKNILEAALGARLFPEGLNLIVTLPGISNQERGYSDLVESLYHRGIIPGLWGTGRWREAEAPGFEDLALSADLVISSSLQEGFGYFFIDAFRWGKPLLSRRLDILEELLPLLPKNRSSLYSSLRIPPDAKWLKGWKKHLKALQRRFPELFNGEGARVPGDDYPLTQRGFDFSVLSPTDQAEVLRKVSSDAGYLKEVAARNPSYGEVADWVLQKSCIAPPGTGLETVDEHWGLEAFGRRMAELLIRAAEETSDSQGFGRERDVLSAFTTPDNLRPLFFPFPGGSR